MDIESHGGYDSSAVMDATQPGPKCVQGVPFWRQTITPGGSEDCLLLDVLVPREPASGSLPVTVQIHGGGTTSIQTRLTYTCSQRCRL